MMGRLPGSDSLPYIFRWRERGQTLVEVLIAILIVTLVLTAVVISVIVANKSAQFSRHKSRSTFLAQEGIEWVRSQRQEVGWGDFSSLASLGGSEYCLDTLVFTNPGSCGVGEVIDGLYTRSVVLTRDIAGVEVTAAIDVAWFEGTREVSSPVAATFAQYETTN